MENIKIESDMVVDKRTCDICKEKGVELHLYAKGSFSKYYQDPVKNWIHEPKAHNVCYNCSSDLRAQGFFPITIQFES